MNYKYIEGNVFDYTDCYYVHCISADFKLGAGIAKEFDRRFDMRKKLENIKRNNPEVSHEKCILVDNTFNLITKRKYWEKPTYQSLSQSLDELKEIVMKRDDIHTLVMPKIGCGLDRLSWNKVKTMIIEKFIDLKITIIVCYLQGDMMNLIKPIRIRKSTIKDKEFLRLMNILADEYHYENCPTFKKAVDKNYYQHKKQSCTLVNRIDLTTFYILEYFNTPIGCIMVWDNNGETTLTNFIILDKYRGKGFGKILLDYVMEQMPNNYCVLGVFEENTKSLNYYYKYGFKFIQLQKTDEGNLLWLRYDK